ncbi:type IV secretion system protein [Bartonella sp. CB169]|uniref:type IV secretion system protein n=1 Tax=Bartonella sp. CB169 TaxID=3112257 RepID=UPI00300E1DDE
MKNITIIVIISVIFAILNSVRSSSGKDAEKNMFSLVEKIHNSITDSQANLPTISDSSAILNDENFLFSNPQYIYEQSKRAEISAEIPKLFGEIIKNENNLREESINDAREAIDERTQYAAVIDKVVALRTFQETEKRFKEISKLLTYIQKTKTLKDMAELQVRMKGMLAMIQNEATKLQMVAYSRNVEQTLINRLKRKRNVQILQKSNSTMPVIR